MVDPKKLSKLKEALDKHQSEAEDEIANLNLHVLNRDDIPTWKMTECKERKDFLEARVETIKEIKKEIERVFG